MSSRVARLAMSRALTGLAVRTCLVSTGGADPGGPCGAPPGRAGPQDDSAPKATGARVLPGGGSLVADQAGSRIDASCTHNRWQSVSVVSFWTALVARDPGRPLASASELGDGSIGLMLLSMPMPSVGAAVSIGQSEPETIGVAGWRGQFACSSVDGFASAPDRPWCGSGSRSGAMRRGIRGCAGHLVGAR